jgi:hypothetical protein
MEPDNNPAAYKRIDLANLLEMTAGDHALVSKYIGIFINTAPLQLNNLQNAVASENGNLLYSVLHNLKPQIEFIGIKNILPELNLTETTLQENKEVTGSIKNSAGFIFNEITLACKELELIQKDFI